jgi:uncharacterized OB-fold protein
VGEKEAAPARRPHPVPDADSEGFWAAAKKGELRIRRCLSCRTYIHFPAPVCSVCASRDHEWALVSGRGTVYTFTIVAYATTPGFIPPYAVAWIELEEQAGLRMLSDIVECPHDAVRIGMPVEVVFDKLDGAVVAVVPRFRPRSG